MYNYSIMGLFDDHVKEICADILNQYRTGVSDMALFMMTLVPEGEPAADKASKLCAKYDRYRDELESHGAKCGVLIQASIGHGYPLNHKFPFQPMVNLTDGAEQSVVCPYDEDFRAFFKDQCRTIAKHRPALIMLDDDFRLLGRDGMGCACPNHMRAFNRKAGTNHTRESLYALLKQDTQEAREAKAIFLETQRESLVGAAKAMREGIDSVDPSIPGVYCCVAGEFAYEIAQVMAGKGHPVIVRINNGNYTAPGARGLADIMMRAAYQIHTAAGHVDAFLAETDTCPQNRYSTSARGLHAHFTGTILQGASGAKHWITRLSAYEPKSGEAYRKILSENNGFYCALSALVPTLKPLGCRIPIPKQWQYYFDGSWFMKTPNGFSQHVLERLGLPMYFSEKDGGAVFMDGCADRDFSDEEIRHFFEGPVFLAGDTAERLCKRGFANLIGAEVKPWNGRRVTGERYANGNVSGPQVRARQIIPINEKTRADSVAYHAPESITQEDLFPGVSVFHNDAGGMTVTFCGDPNTVFNHLEAFSFLNETRKAQMARLLDEAGCLPVYYPGDAEVLLQAAELPDGGLFAAVFNIGFDPLETVELGVKRKVTRVEYLSKTGERVPCGFTVEGQTETGADLLKIEKRAETLDPAIFFIH